MIAPFVLVQSMITCAAHPTKQDLSNSQAHDDRNDVGGLEGPVRRKNNRISLTRDISAKENYTHMTANIRM